jgi:glycosyltransferase involved in cell wall biosynthesis
MNGSIGSTARVAVNLLWSVPGVGGSEDYLVRQLAGLSVIDHRFTIDVYAPRGFVGRRPEIAERFEVHEAPIDCTSRPRRVWLENTWLAARTATHDIVHHGGGTMPSRSRGATLLTLHDVQWVDYPQYVNPLKLVYLRRAVPSSIARAGRVAVPSAFVADTLQSHFGTPADSIGVVRHGLEPWFDGTATPAGELRRRYALEGRSVLVYPAITHPHKNHAFLVRLLASGQGAWGDPTLSLVFTGSPGSADHSVRAEVTRLGVEDRVVFAGRVSHADRNGLLGMADAMVFPSEYEGFGAPLIEAMRCGAPVLCADRACMPEVVGDAAVVCELTEDAWVEGLTRVRGARESLVARGRSRAREFTAEKSASDLVAQYDALMESRS